MNPSNSYSTFQKSAEQLKVKKREKAASPRRKSRDRGVGGDFLRRSDSFDSIRNRESLILPAEPDNGNRFKSNPGLSRHPVNERTVIIMQCDKIS